MTTTERPTHRTAETPRMGGLIARIRLGRLTAPLPTEYFVILATALLLTGFGLVMVLSATSATGTADGDTPYASLLKQAVFAAIGVPLMLIVGRFPVSLLKRLAWPALIITTAFQMLIYTPLGYTNDGNRNWVHIAGIQAQPAEFLKLALALWIGLVLYRKRTLLGDWRHVFIPVVPVAALALATVMGGGDLGTSMILMLIVLACLFFSGVKLRVFIIPLVVTAAIVALFAIKSPNRMRRILSFLNANCLEPSQYYDHCYQAMHGIFGLAGGGVFGVGLGNSRQKYNWLPAAANDYVFAIIGEELGLIGAILVLVLFAVYTVAAFHIVRKTTDPFVRVVAGGITVWVIGQAMINVAVVVRLFPVLGVPLPFISQGGTSLVSVLLATGVLLALARTLPSRRTPPANG